MGTIESQLTERPRRDATEPPVKALIAGAPAEHFLEVARQAETPNSNATTMPVCSPPADIFALEKYPLWWLWRGFLTLTDIHGAQDCLDTWYYIGKHFRWEYMQDECNPQIRDRWLDDPSSFPSLKPDIDVCGVPPRSRKQRGWYHVHRPPYTICYPSSSTTRMPKPTPASGPALLRLPAELINQIVQHSELARTQAALVCKHWARVCLREPWTAMLRGRAHMMELRSLIAVPGSYLRDSVSGFRIEVHVSQTPRDPESTNAPWLHLLPATRNLLPGCANGMDDVRICGPLGGGLPTMRSVHAHLPRRLPASFSATIQILTLRKVHFRKLGDLAHTLGELGNLWCFSGEELTWAESELGAMPLRWRGRGRGRSSLSRTSLSPKVRLKRCTRNLEAMALVAGARYDSVQLRTVLEAMARARDDSDEPGVGVQMMFERSEVEGLCTVTYHVEVDYALQLRVVQTWPPDSLAPAAPLDTKLNLRLDRELRPRTIERIDWPAYDRVIMDLTQVPGRCVVVTVGLHDWKTDFADRTWRSLATDKNGTQLITDRLPLSCAAGKISFERPADGEWDLRTGEQKRKREEMRRMVEESMKEDSETAEEVKVKIMQEIVAIVEGDPVLWYDLSEIMRECA